MAIIFTPTCSPCNQEEDDGQMSRWSDTTGTLLGHRTVFGSSHESGAVAELHNTLRIPDWTAPDQSQHELRMS